MVDKNLQENIAAVFDQIVEFREDLHRHPELSWQEFRTTEKIKELLQNNGILNLSTPLETGLVADVIFNPGAPFVLLRADIDALPLLDEKDTPYRSQNTGLCHACGHDAHTATMAGVTLALNRLNTSLSFNVRFVFQPAEEPIPSGAPKMIEAGVLENVRYAFGLHMEPRLPLGSIGLTPGWINMQSIRLDLTLEGSGGHSARPHETADLIWIASRIIQDSYQIMYRDINLLDSAVILTFTEIEARQGYNVIPNKLTLTGTLRLSDPQKKNIFLERFQQRLNSLENESGCRINFQYQEGAPAIYNDPDLISLLQQNLLEDFGMPFELHTNFRTPGGDDFSHYCQYVPGAMVRFGVRTEQMTCSLHEGKFDVHPEALKLAVYFFLHQLTKLRP
jgi:amidohydrolase